jgi:hypothetical protein
VLSIIVHGAAMVDCGGGFSDNHHGQLMKDGGAMAYFSLSTVDNSGNYTPSVLKKTFIFLQSHTSSTRDVI